VSWKIVRDDVEKWAREHGVSGQWRTCQTPVSSLRKKIFEEAGEYAGNGSADELHDLRDVIDRLLELVDPNGVHEARHFDKVAQIGTFSKLTEWNPVPAEAVDKEIT